MEKVLTINQFNNLTRELEQVKYPCKCGRRVIISYNQDKQLCSWCHNYVFKNKQAEFKYRLNERLKRSDKE